MELKSLDFKVGSSNPSGISDTIFYAPKSDILVWPEIIDELEDATEDNDLDKDDYVDYDGNFTMVTGKKFLSLYNTQGKGKVSSSTIGEVDCKMNQNTLEIKFPRLTREARGFAKAAANGDFVFIIKHDKQYFVVGNRDYRTNITIDGNTGDSAGSDKGFTIKAEVPDTTAFPRYTGTLSTDKGNLDCATGKFTPAT